MTFKPDITLFYRLSFVYLKFLAQNSILFLIFGIHIFNFSNNLYKWYCTFPSFSTTRAETKTLTTKHKPEVNNSHVATLTPNQSSNQNATLARSRENGDKDRKSKRSRSHRRKSRSERRSKRRRRKSGSRRRCVKWIMVWVNVFNIR